LLVPLLQRQDGAAEVAAAVPVAVALRTPWAAAVTLVAAAECIWAEALEWVAEAGILAAAREWAAAACVAAARLILPPGPVPHGSQRGPDFRGSVRSAGAAVGPPAVAAR
jgi:hypothetical protein